jgi:FlaG protein
MIPERPKEIPMTDFGPDAIRRLIPMPSPLAGASTARNSRAPSSPPPELQQDFATAQEMAAELESRQVNLHFDVDGDTGRVRIELLDSSGEVLREIPATHLLDALSGGATLIDEHA